MTLVERMLRHDAWTTRMLLLQARELSDAQLDRDFELGPRSLRRTFAHIVFNMECWTDLMGGKRQRNGLGGAAAPVTVAALLARLDVVAGELLELGLAVVKDGREDENFVDDLDKPARLKPLGAGLLHVATHGMHHRAQCISMLKQLGVKNTIEGDALSWERQFRGGGEWPEA